MSAIFAEPSCRPNKRWVVRPKAPLDLIQRNVHLPPFVVQLLYNRGLHTAEEIDDFLGCRLRDADPFQLAGMDDAVARIRAALQEGEKIAIFGDFDADGVTATVLLVQTLRALGGQVMHYIPHRVDEGYGVNCDALASLAVAGVRLVITVDCGIRSVEEVDFGRRQGLDIIVTDHHTLGAELPPALACIDPRREDSAYPFRELAGVGVAYKLAQALLRAERRSPILIEPASLQEEDLLDLVALGTVADLVPLVDENRALVTRGLARINQPVRAGVRALLGNAEIRPGKVTSTTISFALAPRLNAAGRLADAGQSYDLLTAGDQAVAARLANNLGLLNRQRQRLTAEAFSMAQARVQAEARMPELLFLSDEDVRAGIIGLVAGQLAEAYYRPAVVVQLDRERHSHGSARSIPEFHITHALDECAGRGLLVRHGGHAAAAGFTVATERLPELEGALKEIAARQLAGQDLSPTVDIDAAVDLQALDWATLALLNQLEPFGYGNAMPLLASYGVEVVEARPVGSDGKHLKMRLSDGRRDDWDAIAFRCGPRAGELCRRIDIAYRLEENEWNGRVRLQLNIEDFRPAA